MTQGLNFGRHGLYLAASLLLGACAVGPDYRQPPAVDTGDGWTLSVNAKDRQIEWVQWWAALGDPVLDRLVADALSSNLNLRQAYARINEARALRDRAAGGYVPVVDTSGSVSRRRQSEHGPLPIASIPGLDRNQTIYEIGFDAAWEIDLFGQTGRALESAQARLQAAQADAIDIRISVAAEVARVYLTLRGAQRELAARQASVETLQQTLDLVQKRYQLGDVAEADIAINQSRLAVAEAGLPGIQARIRAAALGLGVLLGMPPEHELALINMDAPAIALTALPVGERADILRRRPDIRAAERRLAASTADIGVATAELFPQLSIAAGGGFQSLDSSQLFDSDSTTFSLVPLISWRLFDGGRVRAEIRASEARQQQAALAYEQAVLNALSDAERALSDYLLGLDAVERQQLAVNAARRSYQHAQARFQAGDMALTELLTEERVLREAEHNYAQTHTATAINLVALFKALGGGWDMGAVGIGQSESL